MNQDQKEIVDKEMMSDALYSQRLSTESYNLFANECCAPQIRDEFMNILTEEHQIQAELFEEMNKRGWCCMEQVEQEKINKVKEKYKPM